MYLNQTDCASKIICYLERGPAHNRCEYYKSEPEYLLKHNHEEYIEFQRLAAAGMMKYTCGCTFWNVAGEQAETSRQIYQGTTYRVRMLTYEKHPQTNAIVQVVSLHQLPIYTRPPTPLLLLSLSLTLISGLLEM